MPTQLIDFKALKEAANFERVLIHYGIMLSGKGDQRTALCPFHKETKGSFKVNLKRKIFNCFGCKAHGNVLDFVMQKEELSEPQAATKIAEICGLTLPARTEPVRPPGHAIRTGTGGPLKTDDDRPLATGHITAVDKRKAPEMSDTSSEA